MMISTSRSGSGRPACRRRTSCLFGALDRLGGFFVLASIREFAPFVTAVVVAGVAGTAITADLGAGRSARNSTPPGARRRPDQEPVVPRFLALMLITGLMDIYALIFGIVGGIGAELLYNEPLGGFFATLFNNASVTDLWGSVLKTTLFGAIIAIVCSYKGMTASGGAEGVGRAVNEAVVIAFMGVFAFNYVFTQPARHPPGAAGDQVNAGWLAVPRGWLNSIGEIFACTRVAGLVFTGRVFQFFGEALRQTGIIILGSTIVIWGLVFILGLQCGIEGAYFNRSVGAPAYAGVFAAWCDLREVIPYAFGYMLAAKVGTESSPSLGAMRISDEIDALEVMGVPPVTFLAATRLLAAWIAFPFMYLAAVGIGFFASWLAVVEQIGTSPRAATS